MLDYAIDLLLNAVVYAAVLIVVYRLDYRKVKRKNDDLIKALAADQDQRLRLAKAVEAQNRLKRMEVWNIRLLRQEVLELIRKTGGHIDD